VKGIGSGPARLAKKEQRAGALAVSRRFHTNFDRKRNFGAAGANTLPPFNFYTKGFAGGWAERLPVVL
jgi:hypothetical protein